MTDNSSANPARHILDLVRANQFTALSAYLTAYRERSGPPNPRSSAGAMALDLAIKSSHAECVGALVKYGFQGATPGSVMIQSSIADRAECLRAAIDSVERVDAEAAVCALHHALQNGNPVSTALLLNAFPFTEDQLSVALHATVLATTPPCVALLLEQLPPYPLKPSWVVSTARRHGVEALPQLLRLSKPSLLWRTGFRHKTWELLDHLAKNAKISLAQQEAVLAEAPPHEIPYLHQLARQRQEAVALRKSLKLPRTARAPRPRI